ncbi:MAG: D-alanine--D-alanine ligase family protein [Christensenellales bacterium]
MKKIKVGVIFGGQSTEHEISVISGSSVIKNLNKEKYQICPIYISKEGNWYKYTKPVENVEIFSIGEEPKELEKIDNVFEILKEQEVIVPVLHGLYGEDGTIQGLLELLKVPYVGCKVLASGICMDKVYAKIIFEKAKLNQANYAVISSDKENEYTYIDEEMNHRQVKEYEIAKIVEEKLNYPVFVKPSNSGSSVGVNKANNSEELIENIEIASKYDKEILIEQGIIGKEVECAVLGNENVEATCVGQIMSADEFYDYDSKYKNSESKTVIPAKIDTEISEKIRNMAVKAFKAVGGRGLSRVDFFVENGTDEIYINEINTMPGFTTISMYPKLWEHAGLNYSELLDKLIELAM